MTEVWTQRLKTMADARGACKICGERADAYAEVIVRGRHPSQLFSCNSCGFVFIDPVYWLEEAYAAPETSLDVGSVSRNLDVAELLARLLGKVTTRSDLFVDFGGAHGLLVRLMRDKGYHFHLYEPVAANLFATFCVADQKAFPAYRALTAIEVFEHLPDPRRSVSEMLEWSRCIIFTTELCPEERPKPSNWWYFALEEGQHVSFFTQKSLQVLAGRLSLSYSSLGGSWHVLAPRGDPISMIEATTLRARSVSFVGLPLTRFVRCARRAWGGMTRTQQRESLTLRDHVQASSIVLDQLRGQQTARHLDEAMKQAL
ncbi:class I SAM-dependent methyltransferase [Bradyrhizobium sp. ORS 111]|uniref:class I SAM-dependent methyltransferase n=1 Tax=Bradyrhizobium sp. ORS 111 TaxID=1685958 RepID=UPI00388F1270